MLLRLLLKISFLDENPHPPPSSLRSQKQLMGEWGGKFAGTREGTDCIAVGTERAGPSKASHDWVKLLLSLSLRA